MKIIPLTLSAILLCSGTLMSVISEKEGTIDVDTAEDGTSLAEESDMNTLDSEASGENDPAGVIGTASCPYGRYDGIVRNTMNGMPFHSYTCTYGFITVKKAYPVLAPEG